MWVASCLLLLPFAASAASPPATYRIIGFGGASCGSWTADRVERYSTGAIAKGAWILGFLSGIGFASNNDDNPLGGVDAEGVWGWIDNYCRANPIKTLSDATTGFYFFHPKP
jgi:hypothetical protein